MAIRQKIFREKIIIPAIFIAILLSIIVIPIVSFARYKIWVDNLEKETFHKYETFSQKIIPANFSLIETKEHPDTFSSPTKIEQTFRVSGTRTELVNQLEPIFKQYGFKRYIDNTIGELGTTPPYDNYEDRWYFNGPTTSIMIHFFPDDLKSDPQPPPYKVEQIKIWWSCTVGVEACIEDKGLSI